jgi:hypothetical protein
MTAPGARLANALADIAAAAYAARRAIRITEPAGLTPDHLGDILATLHQTLGALSDVSDDTATRVGNLPTEYGNRLAAANGKPQANNRTPDFYASSAERWLQLAAGSLRKADEHLCHAWVKVGCLHLLPPTEPTTEPADWPPRVGDLWRDPNGLLWLYQQTHLGGEVGRRWSAGVRHRFVAAFECDSAGLNHPVTEEQLLALYGDALTLVYREPEESPR